MRLTVCQRGEYRRSSPPGRACTRARWWRSRTSWPLATPCPRRPRWRPFVVESRSVVLRLCGSPGRPCRSGRPVRAFVPFVPFVRSSRLSGAAGVYYYASRAVAPLLCARVAADSSGNAPVSCTSLLAGRLCLIALPIRARRPGLLSSHRQPLQLGPLQLIQHLPHESAVRSATLLRRLP